MLNTLHGRKLKNRTEASNISECVLDNLAIIAMTYQDCHCE